MAWPIRLELPLLCPQPSRIKMDAPSFMDQQMRTMRRRKMTCNDRLLNIILSRLSRKIVIVMGNINSMNDRDNTDIVWQQYPRTMKDNGEKFASLCDAS